MSTAVKEIVEPIDTWKETYSRKYLVTLRERHCDSEAAVFVAQRFSNSNPVGELQLSFRVGQSDSRSSIDLTPSQMRELAGILNEQALYMEVLSGKAVQS